MRLHWPLLNLALLFLIPIAAAAYVGLYTDKFNLPQVQHGKLINPAQTINLAATNKWQVVYASPQPCDLECEQLQKRLNNLHLALGANQSRVTLVTIPSDQIVPAISPNSILILNPRGLYIMHYEATTDHSGILKDLRRLLKYSHAN